MRTSSLTVPEISGLLADRIDQLAPELLSGGHRIGTEWVATDITGAAPRTGGSLRVQLTGQFQGYWRDHATGEGGDPIDLIQGTLRLDKGNAVTWGLRWLGVNGNAPVARPRSQPRPVEPTANERRRAARGAAIWRGSGPIDGSLAEAYLQGRGITATLPPSLRFHLALTYWDAANGKPNLIGKFPALVCGIAAWPDGTIIAVQVIYLNSETAGKADVGCPKKTFGKTTGGAVRLAPHGPRLAIAEGVETALSVWQSCPALPVWSVLGASGFGKVVIPPGVKAIIIAADADEAGETAAQKAAQRFMAEGYGVKIAKPPHGHNDFNDALVAQMQHGEAKIHG